MRMKKIMKFKMMRDSCSWTLYMEADNSSLANNSFANFTLKSFDHTRWLMCTLVINKDRFPDTKRCT